MEQAGQSFIERVSWNNCGLSVLVYQVRSLIEQVVLFLHIFYQRFL